MEGKMISAIILMNILYFTAKGNLIQNSMFLSPLVTINEQLFPFTVPGWNCTNYCELINCTLISLNCSGQALDLSSNSIEVVSQIFPTHMGPHSFQLLFLLPKRNSTLKTLLVYVNGVLIFSFNPIIDSDNLVYTYGSTVDLLEGNNNVTFTMSGYNDACGFRLASVSVSQIIENTQSTESVQTNNLFVDNVIRSPFASNLIAFPASRILLGELVNLFISFDRLQLYYYHNRNYSTQISNFLEGISSLMDEKGSLSRSFENKLIGNAHILQESFTGQFDFKQQYIDTIVSNKSDNGFGFVSNNVNLVFYSIPWFIAIIFSLNLFFRLTFQCKISKIVRKYSFMVPVFFLMVCQGNIQQLSFYAFGEFTIFFSSNFQHKIVNCIILFLFLLVLFFSTAFYFWFWSLNRHKIQYFTDNIKLRFCGLVSYTIDRGLICCIFGAIHQLLLSKPNIQLLALSLCQLGWIISQIVSLNNENYQCCLLVWLNIMEGFLRIGFQFSSYLNTLISDGSLVIQDINHLIHSNQIWLFVSIWTLQFGVCLLLFFKQVFSFCCKKRNTKRKKHNQRAKAPFSIKKSISIKQKADNKKTINFYMVIKNNKLKSFYSRKRKI